MLSRTISIPEQGDSQVFHGLQSFLWESSELMSIDVEIYQQARKVIEEENYRHVNVERLGDDLIISVHQMFSADQSLDPVELIRLAGFSEVDKSGLIPRGRVVWEHSPTDRWQVTAMYMHPANISLAIEWPTKTRQNPRELRLGLQALNRVFNAFKIKMEASPCQR